MRFKGHCHLKTPTSSRRQSQCDRVNGLIVLAFDALSRQFNGKLAFQVSDHAVPATVNGWFSF